MLGRFFCDASIVYTMGNVYLYGMIVGLVNLFLFLPLTIVSYSYILPILLGKKIEVDTFKRPKFLRSKLEIWLPSDLQNGFSGRFIMATKNVCNTLAKRHNVWYNQRINNSVLMQYYWKG